MDPLKTKSPSKDDAKALLTPTFYKGDIEAMDIKSKYNDLFYKTCLMIEALEKFEQHLQENIIIVDKVIYHPHFRKIQVLKDALQKILK